MSGSVPCFWRHKLSLVYSLQLKSSAMSKILLSFGLCSIVTLFLNCVCEIRLCFSFFFKHYHRR